MSTPQPPPFADSYGVPRPLGPRFGLGEVLGTGFKVWGKNVVPFALITAVVLLPHMLWSRHIYSHVQDIVTDAGATTEQAGQMAMLKAMFPILVLREMLTILLCSAVTYGVVMELQGQRAGIFAALGRGLSRFLPTLGVGLLVILCNFGGLVLLVIPGVIAWCALYVTVPVSVVEKPGLFGALKRSAALTKGHRLEIFALGVVVVMANAMVSQLVAMIAAPHVGKDDPESLRIALDTEMPRLAYIEYGQNIILVSLFAVFASVSYYLLRAEKEGTSAQELAKVFA